MRRNSYIERTRMSLPKNNTSKNNDEMAAKKSTSKQKQRRTIGSFIAIKGSANHEPEEDKPESCDAGELVRHLLEKFPDSQMEEALEHPIPADRSSVLGEMAKRFRAMAPDLAIADTSADDFDDLKQSAEAAFPHDPSELRGDPITMGLDLFDWLGQNMRFPYNGGIIGPAAYMYVRLQCYYISKDTTAAGADFVPLALYTALQRLGDTPRFQNRLHRFENSLPRFRDRKLREQLMTYKRAKNRNPLFLNSRYFHNSPFVIDYENNIIGATKAATKQGCISNRSLTGVPDAKCPNIPKFAGAVSAGDSSIARFMKAIGPLCDSAKGE